ncbi:MAG TPA: PilZ domain-containing protein [Thermodesulfovibrionales bacterium]|nr:PilZ domain-containing protein [Thermodesulfovibrionales bacterium]
MRPRRKHERFVRRLETEFVGDGKNYRTISSNFSRYGLFIRTNHAFIPGTELDIIVHLPDGTSCNLRGLVRRAIRTTVVSLKNGMGIELTHRDSNYVRFLKEFDPTETDDPSSFTAHTPSQTEPQPRAGHSVPPEFLIITCKECGVKNKVRSERLSHGPRCGKCGSPISP